MKELKVGDLVKVRKDLIVGQQYGGTYFVNEMQSARGKVRTIKGKPGKSTFFLEGETYYRWSVEMFEEEPTQDAVNTPSHYLHGGIETIEVIRMMLTPEEFRGYCKGNIIKYRERAMFKGNAEEDFAKALKYKEFMEVGDELQTR